MQTNFSIETLIYIGKIFLALAHKERSIKKLKETFCSNIINNNINLYEIYALLNDDSHNNKNHLLCDIDIIKFLFKYGVYANRKEIQFMFRFYCNVYTSKFSFDNFVNFIEYAIEPCKNNMKSDKLNNNNLSSIPFDIIFDLIKIFELEIDLSLIVMQLIKELQTHINFNVRYLFQLMTNNNINGITIKNLISFINNILPNNNLFTNEDAFAIMKRLDVNKNGTIVFNEIYSFFTFCNCAQNCKCAHTEITNNEPISLITTNAYLQKLKYQNEIISNYNNNKHIDQLYQSNKNNLPLPKENSVFMFVNYIKEIMTIETQIENAKINLSQCKDFIPRTAFYIFKEIPYYNNISDNENNVITIKDLQRGLELLNLHLNINEKYLLMRRGVNKRNCYLSYDNFYNFVVPYEKYYRDFVNKRSGIDFECSLNVKIELRNLFKLMSNSEIKLEKMRKEMEYINEEEMKRIFCEMDKNGLGEINKEDLKEYLESKGMCCSDKELSLALIRLDINGDGKIELWEIEIEMGKKDNYN